MYLRSQRPKRRRPVKHPTSTEDADNTVGCESTDSESPSEAEGGAEEQQNTRRSATHQVTTAFIFARQPPDCCKQTNTKQASAYCAY